MNKQTNKQGNRTRQLIYDFIVAYTKENLFPPTIEEIRTGTGIGSKQTVWYQLQKLEKFGLVELRGETNRGIKLIGYELKKIENKSNQTIDNGGA